MKICSSCNSPNRDEANFCGVCGTHMSPPPPPPPPPVSHSIHCNACGAANEEGANFCETCGAFMKPSQADGSAGSSSASASTPAPSHDDGTLPPLPASSATPSAPEAYDDEADADGTVVDSSDVALTEIGPFDADGTVVDSSGIPAPVVDSLDTAATIIVPINPPAPVPTDDQDDELTLIEPPIFIDEATPPDLSATPDPVDDRSGDADMVSASKADSTADAMAAAGDGGFSFIECSNCDTVMRYCPCCGKPLSEVGMIKHE